MIFDPEPISLQERREIPGRREPIQSRSQRTVFRILDATSSLLERTLLEEVTTNRIAAEAGLSVGALYRFFPDKQAILDAIAVRHVEEFRTSLVGTVLQTVASQLSKLQKPTPAAMLNAIIDAYVMYLDAHPDFRAISFGRHISAATKERQVSPDTGVTALLKRYMVEQLDLADTAELDLKLRIVSEAGERLIAHAYEQPTREERDRILAEMKKMLSSYLFPA